MISLPPLPQHFACVWHIDECMRIHGYVAFSAPMMVMTFPLNVSSPSESHDPLSRAYTGLTSTNFSISITP